MAFIPATVPTEIGSSTDGILEENESIRYEFSVPVEGMSVRICVTEGYIIAYGSLSVPNPNGALHDWVLDVEYDGGSKNCDHFFVDPDELPDLQTPVPTSTPGVCYSRSVDDESTSEFTEHNLYLAVTGKSQQNAFALESDTGDAYSSDSSIGK